MSDFDTVPVMAALPMPAPHRSGRRRAALLLALAAVAVSLAPRPAQADGLEALRSFVRDVPSGRADFSQTVVSPDNTRRRQSSGQFAFVRPNKFRFSYAKPFEQLIVGDGQKVWLHDMDLNQVSVRPMDQALGATPAALLSGAALERDFQLQALPAADGMDWVQAVPKQTDGAVRLLKIGFQGKTLAALDITDAFGQRSQLRFTKVEQGLSLSPELFRFTPPKGVDVVSQ